jgi:hypothetical protein
MTSATASAPLIQGYAYGALILTFFGSLWALMTMFGVTSRQRMLLIVVVVLVTVPLAYFSIAAVREARQLPSVLSAEGEARGAKMRIWFGVVAAIEFVSIAIASILLSRAKHDELIPLVTALIVGIHFFPLAAIFQVPVYYLTGAAISLLAALALIAMYFGRTLGAPFAWAVVLGVSNAAILWLTAFNVLSTARQFLAQIA